MAENENEGVSPAEAARRMHEAAERGKTVAAELQRALDNRESAAGSETELTVDDAEADESPRIDLLAQTAGVTLPETGQLNESQIKTLVGAATASGDTEMVEVIGAELHKRGMFALEAGEDAAGETVMSLSPRNRTEEKYSNMLAAAEQKLATAAASVTAKDRAVADGGEARPKSAKAKNKIPMYLDDEDSDVAMRMAARGEAAPKEVKKAQRRMAEAAERAMTVEQPSSEPAAAQGMSAAELGAGLQAAVENEAARRAEAPEANRESTKDALVTEARSAAEKMRAAADQMAAARLEAVRARLGAANEGDQVELTTSAPAEPSGRGERFDREVAFIGQRERDRLSHLEKVYGRMIVEAGADESKAAELRARREEALTAERRYFENVRSDKAQRSDTESAAESAEATVEDAAVRQRRMDGWHEEALVMDRSARKQNEIAEFWDERIAAAKNYSEKKTMEGQKLEAIRQARERHSAISGDALKFNYGLSDDLINKNYREYDAIVGGTADAEDRALARREVLGLEPVPMLEIKKGGLFHRKENRGPKIVEAYFRAPGLENVVVVERRDRSNGELISQEVMTSPDKIRRRTTMQGEVFLPPRGVLRRADRSREEYFKKAMNDHKEFLGGQPIGKFVSSPVTDEIWSDRYAGSYGANPKELSSRYNGPKRGGFWFWLFGGRV